MSSRLESARKVADAVLYEGYLLYPYRASAAKNRSRWQFGVLVPPGFTATEEPAASQTECLLEAGPDTTLHLQLRFLQLQSRTAEEATDDGFRPVARLEAASTTYLTFDEAVDRSADATLPLAELLTGTAQVVTVEFAAGQSVEPVADGRIVHEHWPISAALRVKAEPLPGPYGLARLQVRIENTGSWTGPSRQEALRHSLIATHLLVAVDSGAFVSLLDPPEWAAPAAENCVNLHTWPVLAGEPGSRDLMLSAPIILYDHPAIAPESPGDLFDATEIDEILSLRTMTLTDEEKREARATDARAAEIIDRTDDLPPELLERLHGAIRMLRPRTTVHAGAGEDPDPGARRESVPWWDPGADASVSPESDGVVIGGVEVARGSRVRLLPGRPRGTRRADAHDMFLAGRIALVEAVFLDVDGNRHLAVTLEDDEGADLARAQGRFLYFSPEEVEPL